MRPDLPRDYVVETHGRRHIYMARAAAAALLQLGFAAGHATAAPTRFLAGRAEHPVFLLPGTGTQVLWKRCMRGGWMQRILGDRYASTERFFRELKLTEQARAAGVPVAETLGIAVVETAAGWKRVEMITCVIDGARDLAAALAPAALDPRNSVLDSRERRTLIRDVARALRRFHGQGFLHGDLNLRNIVWRRAGAGHEIVVVDLDPGSWRIDHFPLTPQRNLLRLYRSVVRGEQRGLWRISRTDYYRFLTEYYRADEPGLCQFWRDAGRHRMAWLFLSRPGALRRTPEGTPA